MYFRKPAGLGSNAKRIVRGKRKMFFDLHVRI
jgi:hypothetical protein